MTTVHNKYKDQYDVYIGRGSIFGNPYIIGTDGTREEVIDKYKDWFYNKLTETSFKEAVLKLQHKKLGCFCKPKPCHGDIIADYLNNLQENT